MKQKGICIGCKKRLKRGEFVVLNGGAMVKTRPNARVRDGAVMGDHTLAGFLTVANHFDSRKNYQSMIIEDDGPNGQFEFYACSHKCLIDFLTKHIMHMSRLSKIKRFELAPQSKVGAVGEEWCKKAVNLLGVKKFLITDESMVADFLSATDVYRTNKDLEKIARNAGIKIKDRDYIWQVAKKLKQIQCPKNQKS